MKNILLVLFLISLVAFCACPEYELTFPETAKSEEVLFAAVQLDAEMLSALGGHTEWLRLRDKAARLARLIRIWNPKLQ